MSSYILRIFTTLRYPTLFLLALFLLPPKHPYQLWLTNPFFGMFLPLYCHFNFSHVFFLVRTFAVFFFFSTLVVAVVRPGIYLTAVLLPAVSPTSSPNPIFIPHFLLLVWYNHINQHLQILVSSCESVRMAYISPLRIPHSGGGYSFVAFLSHLSIDHVPILD